MGKTKCVSRHEKTDDLRASEAAVDEERRTLSCVGRWKPRYSSATQCSHMKKQAHEEKAADRRNQHPLEQKYRRQEHAVCSESPVRLDLVRISSFVKKNFLDNLHFGSRELNSFLPKQLWKAEKHTQTHGVSGAVRMITDLDSSSARAWDHSLFGEMFVNNIVWLFLVQDACHLG